MAVSVIRLVTSGLCVHQPRRNKSKGLDMHWVAITSLNCDFDLIMINTFFPQYTPLNNYSKQSFFITDSHNVYEKNFFLMKVQGTGVFCGMPMECRSEHNLLTLE